jgi:hypothetical protein
MLQMALQGSAFVGVCASIGLEAGASLKSKAMKSEEGKFEASLELFAGAKASAEVSVDDSFDEYIPGYSGYKRNNSAFWLLKETYYSLQRSNAKTMVRNTAIKMVKEATRGNRWRYATWQIKANLIADMCSGSGGWIEFAEEDKEDAIIQVVRTFRHLNEANKIEASLAHLNKNIPSELDGAQLAEYQTIRSRLK